MCMSPTTKPPMPCGSTTKMAPSPSRPAAWAAPPDSTAPVEPECPWHSAIWMEMATLKSMSPTSKAKPMVCSKIKMADFWIVHPGGVLLGHREGTPDGPAGSWTSMRMGKRSWWSRVAKCSGASTLPAKTSPTPNQIWCTKSKPPGDSPRLKMCLIRQYQWKPLMAWPMETSTATDG